MPDGEADEVVALEARRAELYAQLSEVGDFRRGSLSAVYRRCGKPNCACAAPGHPGHGPQWNLTRKVNGRTVTEHLKPGPELDKARREIAGYQRFRDLAGQITEVSEQICRLRTVLPGEDAGAPPVTGGEKGGSGRRWPGRGPPSWES